MLPSDNPHHVQVTRYPMSMTGAKLRKKIGLPELVHANESFKLVSKFRAIKACDRLKYLQRMAKIIIGRRSYGEIRQARKGFDSHKIKHLSLSKDCLCYCCCTNQAVIRHHVITLANGGRNKRNNIVPLCHDCHSKIHPHLLNHQD